jgi:hypothetical protein
VTTINGCGLKVQSKIPLYPIYLVAKIISWLHELALVTSYS